MPEHSVQQLIQELDSLDRKGFGRSWCSGDMLDLDHRLAAVAAGTCIAAVELEWEAVGSPDLATGSHWEEDIVPWYGQLLIQRLLLPATWPTFEDFCKH